MAKNRLQLNFQLESAAERAAFVNDYLPRLDFQLTEYELETISNYILWGKNGKGQNIQQEGLVELKKWAPQPVESLEGLIETPGFQEASVRSLREPQARIPRTVFNRAQALAQAPDHLKSTYEELFVQIDTIELILNYYELFAGKRKLPPRDKLIARFSETQQRELNEKALRLSQYKYLKLKHLLVELRAQQYTYYDTFSNKVRSHLESTKPVLEENTIRIDEDIIVYPFGLKSERPLCAKVFNEINPRAFSEIELKEISDMLQEITHERAVIDFTNPEHILHLYNTRADLQEDYARDPQQIYGAAGAVLNTLYFYEQQANLTPLQKDLLEMKMHKESNSAISSYLNKTYNKSYNDNYISTIFHQKIIPQIAGAAAQHREIIENVFYPENFKKCKDCGHVFLLNSDNFVRQKKSTDGFSPRCKECEKKKRSKYKNEVY